MRECTQAKIPQPESDKKNDLSDSTKCKEECPFTKIPCIESAKRGELSDSTKCEKERHFPNICILRVIRVVH